MKVHPGVADPKLARKLAKKVGLSKVKTSTLYTLFKTGAKNTSPYGYSDVMECGTGNLYLAAREDYVWVILFGDSKWFKTSPVLSCTPIDNGFKIETENSYYELRK